MTNKFDKFGKLYNERNSFLEEQQYLHEKHKDIDEDKIIIETNNAYKFTLKFIKATIKSTAGILLIVFASLGIISMIYPSIRSELVKVIFEIFNQGKHMI
mgnify:CR=1 FL=1